MSGTNLQDANLSRASLVGVDLRDADLTGADLTQADVSGADLTGTRFAQTVTARLCYDEHTRWDPEDMPDAPSYEPACTGTETLSQ